MGQQPVALGHVAVIVEQRDAAHQQGGEADPAERAGGGDHRHGDGKA